MRLTTPAIVVPFAIAIACQSVALFTIQRAPKACKPGIRPANPAVPSIRRYVVLNSTGIGLTVMERERPDETWPVTTLTNYGILRMPEIGIEIPLAELYEGMTFPEDDEAGA